MELTLVRKSHSRMYQLRFVEKNKCNSHNKADYWSNLPHLIRAKQSTHINEFKLRVCERWNESIEHQILLRFAVWCFALFGLFGLISFSLSIWILISSTFHFSFKSKSLCFFFAVLYYTGKRLWLIFYPRTKSPSSRRPSASSTRMETVSLFRC